MRKLKWKARWWWGYLTGSRDGIQRYRAGHRWEVPPPVTVRIFYQGAPGDPDSDTPVAYEVTPNA